ncbi:Hypothetical protein A7982_03332 [Minicystis rosea]|nr:Hypothetical protein A7982_03332 [Minicystis rosea]
MSLGSACALDQDSDVNGMNPGLAAADDDVDLDPVKLQAPPIKLRLEAQETPFLAMVALRTEVGGYAGSMEHWFSQATMSQTASTFAPGTSIIVTPLGAETEESIRTWTSPLSLAFSNRRDVGADEWSAGEMRAPETGETLLFMTPHPDDEREYLGILVSKDEREALRFTGWYRSSPPGERGRAFESQSFTQPLTLVLDRSGRPSTNPNLVRECAWYFITMQR